MFFESIQSSHRTTSYSPTATATRNQQVADNYMTLSLKPSSNYCHGESDKNCDSMTTTRHKIDIPKPAPRKTKAFVKQSETNFVSYSSISTIDSIQLPTIKPLIDRYSNNLKLPSSIEPKSLMNNFLISNQSLGAAAIKLQQSNHSKFINQDASNQELVSSTDDDTEDSTDYKNDKPKVSFQLIILLSLYVANLLENLVNNCPEFHF